MTDLDHCLSFAEQSAREIGDQLHEVFQEGRISGELKEDHTLVTAADHQADQIFQSALAQTFPEHGLLSEESSTIYPPGKDLVWVIDPLDGTTNFSQGLHHWGVSIAFLEKGVPRAAALFFPVVDEMYTAADQQGSCLNGQLLQPDDHLKASSLSFFLHCSRTHQRFQVDVPYKSRTLGSAAYNLCAVAKGTGLMGLETTVKLWDIAGAWLVLQEARCAVDIFQGESAVPAGPGIDYNKHIYTVMAAQDETNLQQLARSLKPRTKPKEG